MSATVENIALANLRAPKDEDPEALARFAQRLRRLTWAEMLGANGIKRVILANELIQHNVAIEVRLDLAKFRQRHPDGPASLTVAGPHPLSVAGGDYPPQDYTFTPEWQPLNAAIAFWFHQAQQSLRELGAPYLDDGYYKQRNQEGEVVLNWREVSVPRVADLLQFRSPADKQAAGPQTASGLFLPSVEIPAPRTDTGLPPGLSLDDIPEEPGEPDEAALAPLAPAPRRSPARRS